MGRLEELEYLWVHRIRGPLVQYELRYGGEGKSGEPFLIGLTYDGERSGSLGDRSAPGRASVGPKSAGGRPHESSERNGKTALNGIRANESSKSL
jgi:hypothetical protein